MTPSSQGLEIIIEEETVLQAQHGRYTYELTELVTACIRPVED